MFDIAIKDVRSAFRNGFAVMMMFVAPLAITGLIYLAFGGLSSGGGNYSLPLTRVQVANLDHGAAPANGFNLGRTLVDTLRSRDLAEIVRVLSASDEATARAAVDAQLAEVAVIIPEGITEATLTGQPTQPITLYQDPTATVGPSVVKMLLSGVLDGFSGAQIAAQVAMKQAFAHGQALGSHAIAQVAMDYAEWAEDQGLAMQAGVHPSIAVVPPPKKLQAANQGQAILATIMASMVIFFAFFTGASTAQSILREEEAGTLARLFTTPRPRGAILAGKMLSVFAVVLAQWLTLMLAARLIFGIRWGLALPAALMTVGSIVAAAGFGVFLSGLVKTERQAGPVTGVVVTVSGMLGGLMTTGIPNPPAIMNVLSLIVPQGWALRGWKLVLVGEAAPAVVIPALATLAFGALLFLIGLQLFRRRLA